MAEYYDFSRMVAYNPKIIKTKVMNVANIHLVCSLKPLSISSLEAKCLDKLSTSFSILLSM